ncbi:hypothetical protein NL676_031104 [Syzygium grande]|nr:hypothetical protein NL676_031104 [Syzygium grande]
MAIGELYPKLELHYPIVVRSTLIWVIMDVGTITDLRSKERNCGGAREGGRRGWCLIGMEGVVIKDYGFDKVRCYSG